MITMDMIDKFRKRTNCSYQEAKLFLERNNGDMVDAIVDFERTHSQTNNHQKSSKFKGFFKKAFNTRFIVENKDRTVINLSVLFLGLFILFTIPGLPVIITSLVVALIMGYKFSIEKHTGSNVDINQMFNDVTKSAKDAANSEPNTTDNNKSDEYTVE